MNRAFSNLTVRTISEDLRIIEGRATGPETDRQGDVVESLGASYSLPLPFLLDHDSTQVVGEVESVDVKASGITFRARIKKIEEPGQAKDLVDKAWELVKNGLRKFVSIGFRPTEYSFMDNGGVLYSKWEWLELSAVGIPALPSAAITSVKTGMRSARPPVKLSSVQNLRGSELARHMREALRANLMQIPWEKAIAACPVDDIPWLAGNHPKRPSRRVVRL